LGLSSGVDICCEVRPGISEREVEDNCLPTFVPKCGFSSDSSVDCGGRIGLTRVFSGSCCCLLGFAKSPNTPPCNGLRGRIVGKAGRIFGIDSVLT